MKNSAKKTTKKRNEKVMKPVPPVIMINEDVIRQRAFEIYLEDGDESGDLGNWLRAESELKGLND